MRIDIDKEKTPVKNPADPKSMFIDKRKLQQAMDEVNARMGFVRHPNATSKRAREMMLAHGIRPEDRIFSSEIIRMRYEDEDEE